MHLTKNVSNLGLTAPKASPVVTHQPIMAEVKRLQIFRNIKEHLNLVLKFIFFTTSAMDSLVYHNTKDTSASHMDNNLYVCSID